MYCIFWSCQSFILCYSATLAIAYDHNAAQFDPHVTRRQLPPSLPPIFSFVHQLSLLSERFPSLSLGYQRPDLLDKVINCRSLHSISQVSFDRVHIKKVPVYFTRKYYVLLLFKEFMSNNAHMRNKAKNAYFATK